jgi:hypothetical protein
VGSWKEFRVKEVADFRPVQIGQRTYSLHMSLKSGKYVRLEYSSSSNVQGIREKAARLRAEIGLEAGPVVTRV